MLSKLEEIKLVSQCAFGNNRGAFGKLVEAYQPQLRRFLLNLTMGDENLTDDLAQETFIKAYTGIRAFKGLSALALGSTALPTTNSTARNAADTRNISTKFPNLCKMPRHKRASAPKRKWT